MDYLVHGVTKSWTQLSDSLSPGLSYCYFHNVIWQEELCKAKAKTLMSSFISLDNHPAIIIPTDFTTWIKCCISVAYNIGHLFNV